MAEQNSISAAIARVRSVIEHAHDGVNAGLLHPKNINKKTLRYAPLYTVGKRPAYPQPLRPYDLRSVAEFLGTTQSDGNGGVKADRNTEAALLVLTLREMGTISEVVFEKICSGETELSINTLREMIKIHRPKASLRT